MKKPVTIFSSFVLITASAIAAFAPPVSGTPHPDATNAKLQALSKTGAISPAQAEMVKRARAAAAAHTMEANSSMPGGAKAPAGAAVPPTGAPTGAAAQAAPPPPPPPPPAPPKWRLEGTVVGGHAAPSAIFQVDGWGEVLIHPGERLNDHVKVMSVRGRQVTLLTDGKHLQRISPW